MPEASILPADLLAEGRCVGTGATSDRLVIGPKHREAGERPESIRTERVFCVPIAHT